MFNRVDRAVLAPSRCIFCHRQDGPMIDTGLLERMPFGRIYVCLTSCIPQFIDLAGGLTAEQAKHVTGELGKLRRELDAIGPELARLQRMEAAVASARETVEV